MPLDASSIDIKLSPANIVENCNWIPSKGDAENKCACSTWSKGLLYT